MTSQSDMLLYVKLPFTGCHVIRTVDCSELPPKHAATFEIPDIAYGGCQGHVLFRRQSICHRQVRDGSIFIQHEEQNGAVAFQDWRI